MAENIGFIDELIRLSQENENVTKWIDNFGSQFNSSNSTEERNHFLALICNWDNDMAQLVQTELLKEIYEQLESEEYQFQLFEMEKNVTQAIVNAPLVKSFLEKVEAPNSKEFLRDHLFPKILLEKAANVKSFATVLCKTCSYKFRKDDSFYERKTGAKIDANQDVCFFGYNCNLAVTILFCFSKL